MAHPTPESLFRRHPVVAVSQDGTARCSLVLARPRLEGGVLKAFVLNGAWWASIDVDWKITCLTPGSVHATWTTPVWAGRLPSDGSLPPMWDYANPTLEYIDACIARGETGLPALSMA